MEKIKLIYVTTDLVSKVVEGQVYNLLDYYKSLDAFEEVVLIQPYKSEAQLLYAKEVLSRFNFRVVYLKLRPLAPNKFFTNVRNLKTVLDREMTSNTVIHTRGSLSAPFVRKALPKKYKSAYILADFRGHTIKEIKVSHRGRFIDYLLVYLVKIPYAKFLLRQDYKDENLFITVVSPYFRDIVIAEGAAKERISVHPNIVSPDFVYSEGDRNAIRAKYNISPNEIVAVMSSSGGDVWQNDQIVIDRLLELGCVVFNLGKNKVERENVINEQLPRSEMPKYLSASDIAVLWRDNVPLNKVACPSKFGEFVTMGLYVIHNGSVDIARRFILEHNAGIILKEPNQIEINRDELTNMRRQERSKAGYEFFSVKHVASDYISHYINRD